MINKTSSYSHDAITVKLPIRQLQLLLMFTHTHNVTAVEQADKQFARPIAKLN